MTDICKEIFVVSSSQSDLHSRIKLSSVLERLQDAADRHLQELGITISEMLKNHYGWMLMTIEIDCEQIPVLEEEWTVSTWSRGYKGVVWLRDYRFEGTEGALGYARSTWTLVDIHKRKILRPSALPYDIPTVTSQSSSGDMPDKVSISEAIELKTAYEFKAGYSTTDSNGHLNNARYADLCYDALTAEELEHLVWRRFRITYHREVRLNETFTLQRSDGDGSSIWFRGMNSEGFSIFEAQLVYEQQLTQ
ncbi:acyl-[acyl-carrier-protein] thioesterase [Paenibacillus sp. PDC88]|uniref:acyl-[acyl-carrier-protein] thioesterase n=1 Tax=Paenibacillus sp. PDC88 TaxID=1884375 RepID=UPI000898E415|nr:acyl-ACP thioesterase domain-containing protein [Paenibacillus sp. PDC88]SDW12313.1 Acyl-ACP thioesterase [Paenibacillus sp. PDC88]